MLLIVHSYLRFFVFRKRISECFLYKCSVVLHCWLLVWIHHQYPFLADQLLHQMLLFFWWIVCCCQASQQESQRTYIPPCLTKDCYRSFLKTLSDPLHSISQSRFYLKESPVMTVFSLLVRTLCLSALQIFSEFSVIKETFVSLWIFLRCCHLILLFSVSDSAEILSVTGRSRDEFWIIGYWKDKKPMYILEKIPRRVKNFLKNFI